MRGSLHAANAKSGGGDQGRCCIEANARCIMPIHGMVLEPAAQHDLWISISLQVLSLQVLKENGNSMLLGVMKENQLDDGWSPSISDYD